MAETIEGKVAKIIDEKTMVINVGGAAGVKPGMLFVIFADMDEVKDPDTGEVLGSWEAIKGHVQAAHVQERLSVCAPAVPKAAGAEKTEGGSRVLSAEMIAASFTSAGGAGSPKLNVRTADVSGLPEIGPIAVGDKVRSISEES